MVSKESGIMMVLVRKWGNRLIEIVGWALLIQLWSSRCILMLGWMRNNSVVGIGSRAKGCVHLDR